MTAPDHWAAVDALFARVVDLSPEARKAQLTGYAGDGAVVQEVESLLHALDTGKVNLEPSPGASHLTLGGASAVLAVTLVGRRLGPWAVVREIGRGGMGAVYEAFRADDQYQKRVAIKTLARGADSDIVARRFQQERQILASLEHPGIATLIDGGVTDEGLPYLVMEYVDGAPIDQYCASRRMPIRSRLDLFRQVCAAVQYAHRNLVVHRDLKPSNILVTADGVVKLVDFGIAKLLGALPTGEMALTETGARVFTTGYASPEQIRGQPISTATDVYSLGATLYRLVAGRLPFDVTSLTPTDAVRAICEDPPTAPSRACTDQAAVERGLVSGAALSRELAGELDDIVLAALRKEPERRYATVDALSDDLKRYLQGQQVSARPDTLRYRLRSFARRHRGLVAATALGMVFLSVGAGLAGWQAVRASGERDRARSEAARSARVVAFIEQLLAAPAQGALTEATIRSLNEAVSRAGRELGDDPLARAAVYRTAAKAYASHVRDERALPLLDSAMALDRAFAGVRSVEMARDLTTLARIAYNRGLLDSAVAYSRQAVERLRVLPSDRPDDLPTALLYHSFALSYAGNPELGAEVAAEGIALESPHRPSGLLAYLYMAQGEAAYFQGDAAGTEDGYRRSAAMYEALPEGEPVEAGIAEMGLASLLADQGKLVEARMRALRALEIFLDRWGPDHAYTGRAHAVLALVEVASGDTVAASRELAEATRSLERSRLGLVDWISIELAVARVQLGLGQREAAIARLRAAMASRHAEMEQSPQMLSLVEVLLGNSLIGMHRGVEALATFQQVYARQAATYGRDHRFTRRSAAQLLFLASALGDEATASRMAEHFTADSATAIRARGRAWGSVPP